jgi:hypothetical protein
VLQTKNSYTLHQIWLESVKELKRKNSYVAYVSRRVPNSRYTKFGLNRLRGQRVNLEHTDRHTFAFIYKIITKTGFSVKFIVQEKALKHIKNIQIIYTITEAQITKSF